MRVEVAALTRGSGSALAITVYARNTGSSDLLVDAMYVKLSREDLKWLISTSEAVKELSQRYSFVVLALGYANVSDARQLRGYMSFVSLLAKRFGSVPYVSDLHLTWVNAKYAGMAREYPAPRTRPPLALAVLLVAACSLWLALRRARSK